MSYSPVSGGNKNLSLWSWFHSLLLLDSMPEVLVMDGGVSTHLENMIAPNKFSHRVLWSSSLLLTERGRASISKGHTDWLQSGCDILTTVTYQCHYGLFKDPYPAESASNSEDVATTNEHENLTTIYLPEQMIRNMMIDGILLAKQAIEMATVKPRKMNRADSFSSSSTTLRPFVVASTGPYGAGMADGSEYTGKYPQHVTRQELLDFHRGKARTLLIDGKPDGLAIETIPNIVEVEVVCEVLREVQQEYEELTSDSSPIACWISLACRNENEINDGNTVEEALRIIQSYDPTGRWIAGVGINCFDSGHLPSLITKLAKGSLLRGGYRRGIIISPNSGEQWDAAKEEWKDGSGTTDDELADRLVTAVKLIRETCKVELGSSSTPFATSSVPKIILGGCCRTNPATITLLRRKIEESGLITNKR